MDPVADRNRTSVESEPTQHMLNRNFLQALTLKVPGATARHHTPSQGQASSPYIEARREWNERYGEYIQQARHWRNMAICSVVVLVVSLGGALYISAQRKIQPYVIQVDKLQLAEPYTQTHGTQVDPRIIKAYLARFVADWRTVTVDRQAQKGAIDRVFAMLPTGSVALVKMDDFFKARNPFTVAASHSIDITVTNLLPVSDQTWQVEWKEETRDLRGQLQSSVRMKVTVIVGITPPSEENLIVVNPLGVYITDLNWSRRL